MPPYSSDHSFTRQNISTVTATVDDVALAGILEVPGFIQDEIRKKTSTSADFREGVIEYYMQYSPRATWGELAGELYHWECGEGLAAARKFIKRTPGKCVYIPLSNSPSSHVNCGLVVQVNDMRANSLVAFPFSRFCL